MFAPTVIIKIQNCLLKLKIGTHTNSKKNENKSSPYLFYTENTLLRQISSENSKLFI